MDKKNNLFSEKFKKFVNKSIKTILIHSDLPEYKYNLIFSDTHVKDNDKRGHSIEAEIDVLPEYQSFTMTIYKIMEKDFKKGFKDNVFDILCHEIGHIHTEKLYDIGEKPYKTEEELTKTNEELATKIGNYLFRICNKK